MYIFTLKNPEAYGNMVVSCYLGTRGFIKIHSREIVTKWHYFIYYNIVSKFLGEKFVCCQREID